MNPTLIVLLVTKFVSSKSCSHTSQVWIGLQNFSKLCVSLAISLLEMTACDILKAFPLISLYFRLQETIMCRVSILQKTEIQNPEEIQRDIS